MTIRPYTAADKHACLNAFRSNMPRFFAPEELNDFDAWLDTQAQRDLADKDKSECYFVIETNGQVIGCGGYYVRPDKTTAVMTWGMLHQQYHKQGWGKQLFQYRVSIIKEVCPACTIQLDTTQHSAPFFAKMGFAVTKVTPDFYGPGLDRYDMELKN
ncbi:GNAT family N-acetyltransferase [Chitinophaga sp. G-6-1-13]|uniref:GNAT family N-acetyltransferase n=1 Tax=Chitinophaga fulva TaxID=2728842 RepID=A0A848GN87_9BACT|nr:GNAT family N-acetyltransferase [Chitinophaga fulva]NML38849.1 GNAT family N-acetyltransferase [Chitinophaga fulva]